jgi:hypothetical protein
LVLFASSLYRSDFSSSLFINALLAAAVQGKDLLNVDSNSLYCFASVLVNHHFLVFFSIIPSNDSTRIGVFVGSITQDICDLSQLNFHSFHSWVSLVINDSSLLIVFWSLLISSSLQAFLTRGHITGILPAAVITFSALLGNLTHLNFAACSSANDLI